LYFVSQGIEEEDVSPGFVLCDASTPIKTGKIFDAQVVILEHKSIICAGYSAVMHIHCAAEEITVKVSDLERLDLRPIPIITMCSVLFTGPYLLSR
jgi:peptide chain release factor subunit 3